MLGEDILPCLDRIQDPQASEVVPYIRKLVTEGRNIALSVSIYVSHRAGLGRGMVQDAIAALGLPDRIPEKSF